MKKTDIKTLEWVKEVEERGAGEILLTSMDHDGTKAGFADELIRKVNEIVNIPVIASGGGDNTSHFISVFEEGKADAALAASIFHYKEVDIVDLKKALQASGIDKRLQ